MATRIKVLSYLMAACGALLLTVAIASLIAIWSSSLSDPYHPAYVVVPAWLPQAFVLVSALVAGGVMLSYRIASRQNARLSRVSLVAIVLTVAAWATVVTSWAVAGGWVAA